jgi:hypothetical protein
MAENACHLDYVDTWSAKQVHLPSRSQSANWCTPSYGCGDTEKFESGVVRARHQIMRIHPCIAQESKIQWFPTTLHNIGGINQCEACCGCLEASPVVDPVDVEKAFGNSALHYHYQQRHLHLYGWQRGSFS